MYGLKPGGGGCPSIMYPGPFDDVLTPMHDGPKSFVG
jgi:hypothetical protein